MHNAAFRAVKMDWRYELLETPGEVLPRAVARLRREDCAGANVTVPHKEAIVPWLDEVGERARTIGAVNTIVNRRGELIGENTDGDGFLQALREAQVDLRNAHVVILGAGGAARAAAVVAAESGAARIVILNRTPARAESLARFLRERFSNVTIDVNARDLLKSANLVVNATPVGLSPRVNESPMPGAFPHGAVAFDLVYRPAQTRFLRDAASAGARTIGGLGMLVHQGAAAFKLWTGRDAPIEVMFQAARQALNGVEDAAFPYGR